MSDIKRIWTAKELQARLEPAVLNADDYALVSYLAQGTRLMAWLEAQRVRSQEDTLEEYKGMIWSEQAVDDFIKDGFAALEEGEDK